MSRWSFLFSWSHPSLLVRLSRSCWIVSTGFCRRGYGHGLCSPIGRVQFCRVSAVRLARRVEKGSEAADGWQGYTLILFQGKMATASGGACCEVPDGSAGRSFCWHGHEVYDGFPTVGSAVTYGRVMKALRGAQRKGIVQGPGESLWHIVTGSLCVDILCAKSHFSRFKRWVGLFQAQAAIRKRPGCFLLEGLGAIPGSHAETEDGLALA